MTVLVVVALSICAAVTLQEPEVRKPSGRIAGRVVAADSGKPLPYARVRLYSYTLPVNRLSLTDAEGRFELAGLEAGEYRLNAGAERYLTMDLGGRPDVGMSSSTQPVILKDGEQFVKADFKLPRGGAIEGTLVDEFGDSAPGLAVQLARLQYAGGRRRLMPVGGPGQTRLTDDKGRFRVHGLAPGTYYVSALSGAFATQAETGGFAPTYYPGTPDVSAAKPVTVGVGQNLELTFPLTPARMARLSGRVVNAAGEPVRGTLMLSTSDRLGISDFNITRGASEPDGTFVFRNVPPGSYTIQGFGAQVVSNAGNLGASEFGWLSLTVDGSDQQGLVVRVSKGPSLKGRVVPEDPAASFDPRAAGFGVSAIPVEFDSAPVGGGPAPFTVNEDGTFELMNMSGRRVLRAQTRSPGWMVTRITRQSHDITDEPVDFTKGDVEDVEVTVTNRVPVISGTVTDDRGQRVRGYAIVLFATDPSKWTDRSRFIALGRASPDGTYTVRALPPDEYYAVALPDVQGSEWQDPDYLKILQESATRFFLGEGEQKALSLRLRTP